MSSTPRIRQMLALAGAGVVAAAAVAALAWADHDPNVVHVCKHKHSGKARIVSGPEDCHPSEIHQELVSGGSSAGAEAYARVEDGTLDAARSKNVVSMTVATQTRSETDLRFYCFDLTFVPLNAVASGELEPGVAGAAFAFPAVAGTDAMAASPCPAGTDAAVQYGVTGGPDSFYARFVT
jgi:hypothetical protein